MNYSGVFKYKDVEYPVVVAEKDATKRTDVFLEKRKLSNPREEDILFSVYENSLTGTKEYCGNLDAYYAMERLIREARLYRFQEEEVAEFDDFEEGKVIFVCNQKSERFEYNYKSENNLRVYRYMRSPEATLELKVNDELLTTATKHITLKYVVQEIEKTGFNEDSIILSRMATISELREKFDLSWLRGKDYRWIDSIDELKKQMAEFREYVKANPKNALISVDTETTGLNIYGLPEGSEEKDKLVSIVLTWKEDFGLYIPIAHKYEENIDLDEVMAVLIPYLEKVPLLTQNGVFDYKVFMDYKKENGDLVKLNIKEDTLIQNYILQPNPKRGSRALKDNVWRHLGIKQLALTDLFPPTKDGGKAEIRFELLPKETALIYAVPDVDLLLKLYRILGDQIPDISKSIYKTEIGFMPIAAEAEYYGLKINMEQFQVEKKLCEELTFQLQEVLYKLAGYRFNLNSPDQVSDFLYNRLGCDIIISSKTNPAKGSTSSKALKNLAKIKAETPNKIFNSDMIQEVKENGEVVDRRIILEADKLNELKYPAVKVLMEYRNYSKLLTSFFNSIEESNKGGRLYSWINQTGAQTGRIISPLQTLPPFIKRMIIPDTSEHGFIVMDYKQIELRLMFGLAKETEMIEESTDPGKDIHRIVAARLYEMPIWKIHSKLRGDSKGLNFGIPYSLGDYSLATTLYGFPKNDEHRKEIIAKAQESRRRYFEVMPRVERLFIDAKNFIQEHGCIYTMLGRGFYYESILEETNRGKIARILRQGGNGIIQGLGADLFKKGTVDFQKSIKKRGWDKLVNVENPLTGEKEGEYPLVRQAFFVHDELGSVYHKKSINPVQVIYELCKTMLIKLKGFPPLYIGPAVVGTWADAKSDKFEIPTELLEKWCEEVEAGMHTEPLENPEEWVYEQIVTFNQQGMFEYFDQLKTQLKENGEQVTPANIAKIFRHDVLTHELIAMYKTKEFEEIHNRPPEHEEFIEFSVHKYIKDYNVPMDDSESVIDIATLIDGDNIDATDGQTNVGSSDIYSLLDITEDDSHVPSTGKDNIITLSTLQQEREEIIELADELDEFANPIDVGVNYTFDDTDDDEYEDMYFHFSEGTFSKVEYAKRTEEIKEGFSKYISTVARQKIIKLDLVNQEALNVLTEYLQEQRREDGLYGVSFMKGGKIVETDIKVDRLDDALVDMILSKSSEEINEMLSKME